MSSSIFRTSVFFLMVSHLQFLLVLSGYVYDHDQGYSECSSFSCGNFRDIGYPFLRNNQPEYCGHPGFNLDCQGDQVTIDINSHKFNIIEMDYQAQVLKIARRDFMLNICLESFINITLDFNLFNYTSNYQFASLLYDCNHRIDVDRPRLQEFTCPINNRPSDCYFTTPEISSNDELSRRCNISLLMPVLAVAIQGFISYSWRIDQLVKEGFEDRWMIDQGQCRDCLIQEGNGDITGMLMNYLLLPGSSFFKDMSGHRAPTKH